MTKKIISRITKVALAGAIAIAPALTFASSASATETPDTPAVVIDPVTGEVDRSGLTREVKPASDSVETVDGIAATSIEIAPISGDVATDDGSEPIEPISGELDPSVVGDDGELDRSDLARGPVEGDEDGDGYVDIAPISAEITPISADVPDPSASTAWIIWAVAGVVVAGGAVTIFAIRRRSSLS